MFALIFSPSLFLALALFLYSLCVAQNKVIRCRVMHRTLELVLLPSMCSLVRAQATLQGTALEIAEPENELIYASDTTLDIGYRHIYIPNYIFFTVNSCVNRNINEVYALQRGRGETSR